MSILMEELVEQLQYISYYALVNNDYYHNNINANYGGYVNEGIKF